MNWYSKVMSLIFFPAIVSGQEIYHRHLRELTQAELKFAAMAEQHNTRVAFLNNLDSGGVLFNGHQPVNGVELYTKVNENPRELLTWYPSFAEVSEAGDLGFTTGPFWYYEQRGNDKRLSGHFFTIWRRVRDGQLKVWLDAGISNTPGAHPAVMVRRMEEIVDLQLSGVVANQSNVKADKQQSMFFEALAINAETAYRKYLGDSAVLLRKDEPLSNNKSQNINIAVRSYQPGNNYIIERAEYNSTGTFYFSYGAINDTSNKIRKGFFVQVWQFQKDGWQLIADVMNVFPVKGA